MHIALLNCHLSHCVQKYNLYIKNRSILHIGCSTGKFSIKLAEKASRVHAFDTNQDYINIANNEYQNLRNIFFENCCAPHFDCPRSCDLAIIDFTVMKDYTHTNKERKALFQCINQHLSQNGELFISIVTNDNTLHPNIAVATNENTSLALQEIMPDMAIETISDHMIPRYPSAQEIIEILNETGFEVILNKEEINIMAITEKNLRAAYINIVRENPLLKYIPDPTAKDEITALFINSYINTLEKNYHGHLLEQMITTIIRARKK
jgi:2-polyprenyl-3-methyl-5-hydroxy-6-metoxy-1,4-benzoquinol methylase